MDIVPNTILCLIASVQQILSPLLRQGPAHTPIVVHLCPLNVTQHVAIEWTVVVFRIRPKLVFYCVPFAMTRYEKTCLFLTNSTCDDLCNCHCLQTTAGPLAKQVRVGSSMFEPTFPWQTACTPAAQGVVMKASYARASQASCIPTCTRHVRRHQVAMGH